MDWIKTGSSIPQLWSKPGGAHHTCTTDGLLLLRKSSQSTIRMMNMDGRPTCLIRKLRIWPTSCSRSSIVRNWAIIYSSFLFSIFVFLLDWAWLFSVVPFCLYLFCPYRPYLFLLAWKWFVFLNLSPDEASLSFIEPFLRKPLLMISTIQHTMDRCQAWVFGFRRKSSRSSRKDWIFR